MTEKVYKDMNHDEQVEFIGRLTDFMENDVPELRKAGRYFSAENVERFKKGLALLGALNPSGAFYQLALKASSNYDQHATTMIHHLQLKSKRLAASVLGTENVIIVGQPQSLRRGRPTAAESAQREAEKQANEKALAIARLTGAKVATTEAEAIAERDSDTSRRKKDEEADLFSSAVDNEVKDTDKDNTNDGGATTKDPSPTPSDAAVSAEELKALREWIWILPEKYGTQIKAIKDMRAEESWHCEEAKRLLLEGAEEEQVIVHTNRAKEINSELSDLYAAINYHLSLYYVMLVEVNKDYGKFAEKYEKHGGYDVLVNDLKVYYDRYVADEETHSALLLSAKALEAKRVKAETKDPEKEKAIHNIKSYFSRKDVKKTPERLAKLKTCYEDAVKLEVDEDTLTGFRVIIEKLEADIAATENK